MMEGGPVIGVDGLPAPDTFAKSIKPFRWRIAFTYALMLVETGFEVLYPFTMGIAINGLINGDGFIAALPFAATWFAHIASATFRQMYDTRLFARVYGLIAGNLILRQRAQGEDDSAIAARSAMAREAIDFFEFEIPTAVTAIVTLVGGVGMLFFYDVVSGAIMAFLMAPVYVIYRIYGGKSLALSRRLNNRLEREVDVITDGRRKRVRMHFSALRKWRVFLSDLQAWYWAFADVFIFSALLFILVRLTSLPGVTPGDVFAGLSYGLSIALALDQAPILIEQFSRLVDIRRRVDNELAAKPAETDQE